MNYRRWSSGDPSIKPISSPSASFRFKTPLYAVGKQKPRSTSKLQGLEKQMRRAALQLQQSLNRHQEDTEKQIEQAVRMFMKDLDQHMTSFKTETDQVATKWQQILNHVNVGVQERSHSLEQLSAFMDHMMDDHQSQLKKTTQRDQEAWQTALQGYQHFQENEVSQHAQALQEWMQGQVDEMKTFVESSKKNTPNQLKKLKTSLAAMLAQVY